MIPITKCSNKYSQKIYDAIESFSNTPEIKSKLQTPGNMAALKFEQIFNRKLEEFDVIDYKTLGMSKVNQFKSELKWVARKIRKEKVTSRFGKWAYTTQARTRYNPIGSDLHGKFVATTHFYKARNVRNNRSTNVILNHLRDYAVQKGFLKSQGLREKIGQDQWNRAMKKSTKLENDIVQAELDLVKDPKSREKERILDEAVKRQEEFLMTEEGAVFKEFVDIIQGSKDKTGVMGLKDLAQDIATKYADDAILERTGEGRLKSSLVDKMNAQLGKLTDNQFLKEAVKEYIILMRHNHHTLIRGSDAFINSLKTGLESMGRSTQEIDIISDKITKLISPSEEIGYFPQYRYDLNVDFMDNLMPRLEALNVVTRESLVRDNVKIDQAIGEMNKYLDSQSYITQRAKPRKKGTLEKYSLNFPVVLKRYTDEISRFNFMAHSNMYARESLSAVKKMWREGIEIDGYGRDVLKEILDLHEAQTGVRSTDHPELNALARTMLNIEFVSKLGLNPRGATRNLTQALLNLVQWNPFQVFRARKFYKHEAGAEFEADVEKMFETVGLKYEDPQMLMEAGERTEAFMGAKVRLDKNLTLEFKKPGIWSKASKVTGKLGAKLGKMHSWAENKNRKATFKMAFYEAYKGFKFDGAYNRHFRETYASKHKVKPEDVSEKIIQNDISRRARNYALRMTTLLHFDYSDVSKNKIMKTNLGRLMLQFQHYGLEFFNYNLGIAKGMGHARLNPADPAMHRALGMATIYGTVPFMLSSVLGNTNWFNLIEHNTVERAKQLLAVFTGDEEEIREAFYGKGPLLGVFGGPFFNDVLIAGQMYKWWDLSEQEFIGLGEHFDNVSDLESDDRVREILQMSNPSVFRFATQTLPIARTSGIFTALGFELGLYPSSDIKDAKEDVVGALRKVPYFNTAIDKLAAFDEWNEEWVEETRKYLAKKYRKKHASMLDARMDAIKHAHKERRKRYEAKYKVRKRNVRPVL